MQDGKFSPRRLCLLALAALLFSSDAALAQFTQQGSKLVGSGGVSNAHQGGAVSLSSDGNTLITGGVVENGGEGAAWIFTRTGVTWNQQGSKLVGTGASGAAQQGQSVALSGDGNTALVGGWWDNSFVGAAWVFVRSGNTWSQQGAKLVASDSIDQSSQGASVALSEDGNTAIVGGYTDDNSLGGVSYKGAAWIYTRSGTTWTQQAKLTANDETGGGRLGASVSLSADGNTALVGGYQDNGGMGAAWVFTRSGTTWTQQGAKLVDTTASGANQGVSVALSADGTTAVVGGSTDSDNSVPSVTTGAVWVFTRSGNTWTPQGSKLVGTGAVGDSEQGAAVAVSADGNMLLSGGIVDNSQVGATWVFTRSGGVWSQFGNKLVGNDVQNSPEQGFGVALSGNGRTAVVGGPLDHNSIGATWVYAQPVLPATVTLGSSDSTSVFGQSVTFTATVTPSDATGDVDFKFDNAIVGTVALSSGTAQYTTSGLAVGSHTITALYAGDVTYDPATSSGLTQTVSKGATTTTLSVSPATSSPSQTILFTATIHVTSPAAGSPSGTVTFKDGATTLGSGSVASGHATLSKAGLTIGSHKITAVYGGDANFTGSSFTGNSQTGTATVSAKLGAQTGANTHTAGSQQFPAIAKLKSGYFVAWASNGQDGSLFGVYGQRYGANGAKTGGELHISTRTAANQTLPKVAGLKAGGFVAVWQSDAQDGSSTGIYAQNYNAAGGKVGAEFRVNTTIASAQAQPAIAALASGGFVVAWASNGQDKSGLGVYAQRYDATAKVVGTEFLVNTTTAGAQSAPAIAALTDGGFVVAWQGPDASGLGIYGQRFTSAGVKSGAEFRINTTTANDQSLPSAAGLNDGGFVLTWQSKLQDGSGLGVYAQRYKSNGARNGGETRVTTMTANDQWQPQVSGFSNGGFVVVWSSRNQDGSGQGVYTQAFKATGAKANVEFLANTTTAGNQWQPAVAAGATGEFMAAWTSNGQDGSLEGIYTQRFRVPVSP